MPRTDSSLTRAESLLGYATGLSALACGSLFTARPFSVCGDDGYSGTPGRAGQSTGDAAGEEEQAPQARRQPPRLNGLRGLTLLARHAQRIDGFGREET
jgi:hypothetical protein